MQQSQGFFSLFNVFHNGAKLFSFYRLKTQKYLVKLEKGTIHKRCQQLFRILTPPSPISAVFLYYPSAILTNFWPLPPPNYRRRLWTAPNLKNQMGFYKNIFGLFVSLAATDWVFRANWVLHGLIICLIYYVHIRMLLLQSEGQFFFWSHAGGLKKIGTRTLLLHDYLTDFFVSVWVKPQ